MGQMLGAFALSVMMMLLIAGGFGYTLFAIQRTKRWTGFSATWSTTSPTNSKPPFPALAWPAKRCLTPRLTTNPSKHYLHLIREENKRLGVLVENVLRASLSESGAMRLYVQSLNLHDLDQGGGQKHGHAIPQAGGEGGFGLAGEQPQPGGGPHPLDQHPFQPDRQRDEVRQRGPAHCHSHEQTPDGVSLHIQDNGVGIAKEHLGKVFERLYRVPTGNVHDVKGFGLGLSYVKNVVERHGGSVQIASRVGEGTTLKLMLPFECQPDKTHTS